MNAPGPDPRDIPLGLYVHVPWCVRKCPYCDFNSHGLGDAEPPWSAYVDALLEDLTQVAPDATGRVVETVFIGGGTPSLMPPAQLARLLEGVAGRLPLAGDAEVTLEANPGTVDAGHFAGYRAAGVNRLSIGVQSLADSQLSALGRIHDAGAAVAAAGAARKAGFERFNLDLMFGLPGQTLDGALADVDRAVDLGPDHLSHYQLTLEPNTAFHAAPPPLPEADAVADMGAAGAERLAAAGYRRYEVSAWARPGGRCRHNENYWRFGDYLGIGAGAHGKVTGPAGVVRTTRHRRPRDYLEARGGTRVSGAAPVPVVDLPLEFMLNALRLVEGVPAGLLPERTGIGVEALRPALARAVAAGLLADDPQRFRATPRGLLFLDDLVGLFLP